ncbi:unnamed protein product [Echinostoma caproni]|uniref:phosphatidate phosphatase n=1 Tax=Echinostoma caproni TaxID=27848 RepID=A0A183AZE8_9TREM|nr:unnamed protein product [Echinostoma caproni]
MMSWKSLGRIFSGIKGAYNDINPSTLTGAIDVIVVEQPDGTYECGPLYVRFGKLTAISPADKVVEVYVNGRYVDFLRMRLGAAGDAYFVDSDACSSDDEKYPTGDSESRRVANIKWPESVTRRRRRKVRRDSAMSEPDSPTLIDDLNDDDAIRSDSEQLDVTEHDRSNLLNHYGSDGFLIDSLNSIGEDLSWAYGGLLHRRSECQPPTFKKSESIPDTGHTDSPKIFENEDKKDNKPNPLKKDEVYLEDLVTSEMDPTVKETYIYPPTHHNYSGVSRSDNFLHRSAAEVNSVDAGYRSDGEQSPRSLSPIYPSIYGLKLSLCGSPSMDAQISDEKFVEHLVSFEEFIHDPEAILSNPNLTVQLNNKYMCWPLAAPSIISILAYQTELPHRTVRHLESVHQSKKQTRRTSWFSWGSRRAEAEDHDETKIAETVALPEVVEEPVVVMDTPRTINDNPDHDEKKTPKTHSTLKKNRLSTSDISRLNLKKGRNDLEFRVTTKYQGTCICSASIFLWHWSDRIVISDVDGTITRSDLLGHLLPMLGHDWTHDGVACLYDRIARNGYRFVYLSARALGQAGITRSYLRHVVQEELKLPDGPILLSPNSLLHALHQEVIEKKPENFKIKCLSDVTALFPKGCQPLYAGFGNKVNDVFAYEQAGIERCRIFTVNPRGELRNEYHSVKSTSYRELIESVDLHFPLILDESRAPSPVFHGEYTPENASESSKSVGQIFRRSSVGVTSADMSMYSCFTYWRTDELDAVPDPDVPT